MTLSRLCVGDVEKIVVKDVAPESSQTNCSVARQDNLCHETKTQ